MKAPTRRTLTTEWEISAKEVETAVRSYFELSDAGKFYTVKDGQAFVPVILTVEELEIEPIPPIEVYAPVMPMPILFVDPSDDIPF